MPTALSWSPESTPQRAQGEKGLLYLLSCVLVDPGFEKPPVCSEAGLFERPRVLLLPVSPDRVKSCLTSTYCRQHNFCGDAAAARVCRTTFADVDRTAAQFESLLHPTFSAREPISPPWECACLPPIPALPDRIKIQTLPSTQIVCIRGVGLGLDKWGGGGSGCNGRIVGHSRWHSQTRPHAATRLERRSGSWTWWSCRVEGGEMRRGDFELRCRGQDYMWEGFCVWLVYLRLESGTSEYHGRFPYQQLRRGPQDQRQIAVGRQTQQRPPSPKYLNPAKLDPLDDSVLCLTFLADVLAPRLERRGRRCRKCGDLAARGPRPTARIHQRRGKPLTLVFSEYTAAPRLKRSGRWQRDIDAEASGAAADSGAFVKGEDSGVSRSQWRRLELPASNVSMELEKEEKFQASFGVVVELVGAKQQTVSLVVKVDLRGNATGGRPGIDRAPAGSC
ncbi:hypothetical protein IWX48DRAFT_643133, partial [Phyllosticta citricarpa]